MNVSGVQRIVALALMELFFSARNSNVPERPREFAEVAAAQQPVPPGCAVPAIPALDAKTDIFNDRQEMDLGDAIAEQFQRDFLVIDDEDVTEYVRKIGAKLLAQAPPTGLKIQFFLFDQAVANAVTLPGGRIYVSRKLIALTRNEDELASVMGHELGHALTHQPAADMTQLLRDVLGVTQAGTREEIFHNYETLYENVVRKKRAFEKAGATEKGEQLIADQVGLQLVTLAGYHPQSFPEFFDRLAQTKGKTGSWISDLFGQTHADEKRLREMRKQVAAIPASCQTTATAGDSPQYRQWRASVVRYSGLGHKEQLHEVFSKARLNPPLQSDIRHLRFSPDGKYLLVQDDATIFVMTREPLAAKFTIYAPDAFPAMFSADSQTIFFYTETLRVESWSVPDETRSSASEMVIEGGCLQSELSADGKFLACYGADFDLAVYEVASGEQRFQKKSFSEPHNYFEYSQYVFGRFFNPGFEFIHMHFSPDARFFVAHGIEDATVAVELSDFHSISLPGTVRELMWGSFTFVGPDKIAGVNRIHTKNSALVRFPSGELIRNIQFGDSHLEAATDLQHVVIRPIVNHPLGVVDLTTGLIVLGSDRFGSDVYGGTYAYERPDGDIGISNLEALKEVSRAKLPVGQLGNLRVASASPDLRWLAISQRSRGGLWDLLKGQRVFYTRGFSGASVSGEGVVDADFTKFKDSKRQMARMDAVRRTIDPGKEIGDEDIRQVGPVLLRRTRKGKDWRLRNITVDVQDAATGHTLWTRDYPKEAPQFLSWRSDGALVFGWPANSEGAKLEIKGDVRLSQRWPKLDAALEDYFIEAVEPTTGNVLGAVIIKTGKRAFHLVSAESSGDWLVAEDNTNRVLVYSLAAGEQAGILFGSDPAISASNALVALQNERGQLLLYDLKTLARREEYFFHSPVVFTCFAADNRRMLVLTGDQTVYFLA